jgi:uncharacterized protein (DUF58 family)
MTAQTTLPNAPPDAARLLAHLEWRVLRRLDGILQGDYRTLFRGFGLDLSDIREYQYGDDVRHIDWNASARLPALHVRQFNEDRDVTAWFLVDISASMGFGSGARTKRTLAIEFTAALAQLLTRHGNRVGVRCCKATPSRKFCLPAIVGDICCNLSRLCKKLRRRYRNHPLISPACLARQRNTCGADHWFL